MKVISFLLILFSFIFTCYSSQETMLKVNQPILIAGYLKESMSTYVYVIGGPPLSLLVELTCAENYIQTETKVVNRNLANIYNLKIEVMYNEYGWPSFGDTLKAKLILPEDFTQTKLHPDLIHDELISATIECAFKNATFSESINYMDLQIIGEAEYLKYAKVYER